MASLLLGYDFVTLSLIQSFNTTFAVFYLLSCRLFLFSYSCRSYCLIVIGPNCSQVGYSYTVHTSPKTMCTSSIVPFIMAFSFQKRKLHHYLCIFKTFNVSKTLYCVRTFRFFFHFHFLSFHAPLPSRRHRPLPSPPPPRSPSSPPSTRLRNDQRT